MLNRIQILPNSAFLLSVSNVTTSSSRQPNVWMDRFWHCTAVTPSAASATPRRRRATSDKAVAKAMGDGAKRWRNDGQMGLLELRFFGIWLIYETPKGPSEWPRIVPPEFGEKLAIWIWQSFCHFKRQNVQSSRPNPVTPPETTRVLPCGAGPNPVFVRHKRLS